jgi:ribosomal protein L34
MDGPILPGAIFRTWPLSVEGYRDRPVTPWGRTVVAPRRRTDDSTRGRPGATGCGKQRG